MVLSGLRGIPSKSPKCWFSAEGKRRDVTVAEPRKERERDNILQSLNHPPLLSAHECQSEGKIKKCKWNINVFLIFEIYINLSLSLSTSRGRSWEVWNDIFLAVDVDVEYSSNEFLQHPWYASPFFLLFKLLNLYKGQRRKEKVDARSRTVERLTPAPLACFQTETSSIEPDSRWEAGGESREVRWSCVGCCQPVLYMKRRMCAHNYTTRWAHVALC